MKPCKLRDVFGDNEDYHFLTNFEYKPIAWGYVTRDGDQGKELLIAERCKVGDELREGELVIPGGGVRQNETLNETAKREVEEETGVITNTGNLSKFTYFYENSVLKPRDKIIGIVEINGNIWLYYIDTKKSYMGILYDLIPLTEPREMVDTDAKKPRYISLKDALDSYKESFTPACQILLEVIETVEFGENLVKSGDLILDPHEAVNDYLKIK